MISPTPGIERLPLKPGSATYPLPGIDALVVNEQGEPAAAGERGFLAIRKPWPGMLLGIHGAPERYREAYWSRFPGLYNTGDYAIRDNDGYFWILGRADEVLKVAGHRLGTAELEEAAVSFPGVAEAAVVGKEDAVKGEVIILFAILKEGVAASERLKGELVNHMRQKIGPIASPEAVYFVAKLPKTRSGKIMRRVLKAAATNARLGDLSTLEDESAVAEIVKNFQPS